MTNLLITREMIKKLFSKYDIYAIPVLKGIFTFIVLNLINLNIGYMEKIDSMVLVLMVSALCGLLPLGFGMLFSTLFILLHLYELGIEIAGIGGGIFLIIYFLYLRFSPKDAIVIMLTPILFLCNMHYVVPLAVGLIATPISIFSVCCGIIIYHFLHLISINTFVLNEMGSEDLISKVRLIIDGLISNKAMFVTMVAFAFIILVVYLIRRLSIDHSWTIALISGSVVNILVLMVGDLMFGTKENLFGVLIGTFLSLILVKILQFFVFNVDYSRTERVQFEDDDYYYYVKAVPKVLMPNTSKTVKQINSRTNNHVSGEDVQKKTALKGKEKRDDIKNNK